MKKKLSILCIFILITSASFSQVRQSAVNFYGGDLSGESYGSFIKTDLSGNVFQAGRSHGQSTNFDYALIKYSAVGNLLWERRFNGEGNGNDEPFGIMTDESGNSYITGTSQFRYDNGGSECVTIKYNAEGNIVWVNKFINYGDKVSCGHTIVKDQENNIYVAGYSGTDEARDLLLLKINSEGQTIWSRTLDGNSINSDYNDMLTIFKENLYICGGAILNSANFLDYVLQKYDLNGNLIWQRSYNGNLNGFDVARSVFADRNENIYITGYTENQNTKLDITTIKYNSDGDEIWVRDFNGSGDGYDWPNHVLVDKFDNVYVEGGSQNVRQTNDECMAELGKCMNDATLIKYLPSGAIDWVRTYNGPDNMYDCLQGMTLDQENNVYVAGRSHNEVAGNNDDIITMKFNTRGDMLWLMKYNSGPSKNDYGNAIVLDNMGNVYSSGWSNGRGNIDFIMIKYSPVKIEADVISDNNSTVNLQTEEKVLGNNVTSDVVPESYSLSQNYPNPFNPSTNLEFGISELGFTSLKIFNAAGKEVATLVNEVLAPGKYNYQFSTVNYQLVSGIYFYKLESGGFVETKRMVLLK
jgi:hypothetical protein